MAGERNRWRVATGNAEKVGAEPLGAAGPRGDGDGLQPVAALGADDLGFEAHLDTTPAGFLGDWRRAARIDDALDLGAGFGEREGRFIGLVVVGEHDRRAARRDAIALHGRERGRGQHDPRPVVVGECDEPLERAGGEHDALRPDAPVALAGREGRRLGEMIGDALDRADDVALVATEDGRALEYPRLGRGLDRLQHLRAPAILLRIEQEPAAELEILLGEDHPEARFRRGSRRYEPGRARSDDEDVAMGMNGLIVIGILAMRWRTEAGAAPDDRLVDLFPEGLRPHEGLVVEARGQEAAEIGVEAEDVALQRRPAILALGDEPFVELLRCHRHVGLAPGARADDGERVRLLRSHGVDAARPVVLEAAAEETNAIGEKRGRERVAGETLVCRSVEAERQPAGAVDAAACRGAKAAHARSAPSAGTASVSEAVPLALISCVSVCRTTLMNCRQPEAWCHHSRCQPRGLRRS